MNAPVLILTCEHASHALPEEAAHFFISAEAQTALHSHEGWDIGAIEIFQRLEPYAHISFRGEYSRLVIELNRSLHHKKLFSRFMATLDAAQRNHYIDRYYAPYRHAVENAIADCIKIGQSVLHLSVHTFTPVMDGVPRECDVGLLYDPKKLDEKDIVQQLFQLFQADGKFRIRKNYPYRGVADGFTTALRKRFRTPLYCGIELEVNNAFFTESRTQREEILDLVSYGVRKIIE